MPGPKPPQIVLSEGERVALEQVVRADSVWGRLRALWTAVSPTVAGDIIATAVAIGSMALLFLACAFGILALAPAGRFMLRLLGAG